MRPVQLLLIWSWVTSEKSLWNRTQETRTSVITTSGVYHFYSKLVTCYLDFNFKWSVRVRLVPSSVTRKFIQIAPNFFKVAKKLYLKVHNFYIKHFWNLKIPNTNHMWKTACLGENWPSKKQSKVAQISKFGQSGHTDAHSSPS